MKFIRVTKENAASLVSALGLADYLKEKGRGVSYYVQDCPLLNGKINYNELCRDKCSLAEKAYGGEVRAGIGMCPMYRLSHIARGASVYDMFVSEDVFAYQECEDI